MSQVPLSLPGYKGPIRDPAVRGSIEHLRRAVSVPTLTHYWSSVGNTDALAAYAIASEDLHLVPMPILPADLAVKYARINVDAGAAGQSVDVGIMRIDWKKMTFDVIPNGLVSIPAHTAGRITATLNKPALVKAGELYYAAICHRGGGLIDLHASAAVADTLIPQQRLTHPAGSSYHGIHFDSTTTSYGSKVPAVLFLSENMNRIF